MKKILTIVLIFLIFITTVSLSISYFKFQDINNENYLEVGTVPRKDISTFLYVAPGPALTFKGEIPHPIENNYDWTRKLSDYPYFNWSNHRKDEIINFVKSNNGLVPISEHYFAKQNDHHFLERNSIYFDITKTTFFHNSRSLHLFAVIYNNAHLNQNRKKINIKNEKNLQVEANVTFQGHKSGTVYETNYKNNIDIYNKRYYVTTAYCYVKQSGNFVKLRQGGSNFYNIADLVIIDLGTTGYIEDGMHWGSKVIKKSPPGIFSTSIYERKPQLQLDLEKNNDTKAKIIKANYTITFTPSWDSSKVFKESITLY